MRFLKKQVPKRIWIPVLLGVFFLSLAWCFHDFKRQLRRIDQKVERIARLYYPVFFRDDTYRAILALYVVSCDKETAELELDILDTTMAERFRRTVAGVNVSDDDAAGEMMNDFKMDHTVPLRKSFADAYHEHCSLQGRFKKLFSTN